MKNVIIFVLILAVLVLGYLQIHKREGEDTPKTDETPIIEEEAPETQKSWFENEKKETVVEETDKLSVDVAYPSFGNKEIDAEIKNFALKDLATFKEESGEPIPGSAAQQYTFDLNYKVVRGDKTTSIIFSESTYSGGAHGNLVMTTFTYTNDGTKVSIGSLFKPGSDYLGKLAQISKVKLKEALPNDLGSWADDGTAAVSANFEAFYLEGKNTVKIIFEPYQVAPWAAGTPEISISFSEFGDIVNDEFVSE